MHGFLRGFLSGDGEKGDSCGAGGSGGGEYPVARAAIHKGGTDCEMLEMVELGDGGVRVAGEGWGLRFAPAPALAWIESAALVAAYVDIFHVSESEKAS